MSTDQTSALSRATEAVREAWGDANIDGHGDEGAGYDESVLARAAVSAALHDPDHPAALARVLATAAREAFVFEPEAEDPSQRLAYWRAELDERRAYWRRVADGLRAAILGEA